jgi:hypothetical protein
VSPRSRLPEQYRARAALAAASAAVPQALIELGL